MFYDIFIELCARKGVKPSRAAEDCGINRSNVASWKKHGYAPRSEALNLIAAYFGVSIDYLLGNKKETSSNDQEEVTFDDFTYAMAGEAAGLTEEDKQTLLDMARFLKQKQQQKN